MREFVIISESSEADSHVHIVEKTEEESGVLGPQLSAANLGSGPEECNGQRKSELKLEDLASFCIVCGEASDGHDTIHSSDNLFECPDCAELFDDFFVFKGHVVDHGTKLLSPNNCEEVTIEGKELSYSQENTHETDEEEEGNDTPAICNEREPFPNAEELQPEYSCKICSKIFLDEPTLKDHEETAHKYRPGDVSWQSKDNKPRPFTCELCDRSFTLASTLTLHKSRTHLGIRPYKCSLCEWTFAQSSDLIKHQRRHTGETLFTCDRCGVGFKRKRAFEDHIQAHSGAKFKCKHCDQEFQLETSLNQHLKRHEGKNVLYCSKCNVPYTNSKYLNTHITRCHREAKRDTKCSFCEMRFRYHNDLLRHERGHTGEKPFSCKSCDKTFAHKASLKNHQVIHSGEKPHQCTYCGASFAFASNLKVHIRIHTGERPYKCDKCEKSFLRSGNLREHIKVHTGEKSYVCETCNKSFASSSTFMKHKKIHTGEKPHKCNVCEKSFIQLVHLTKHLRVHTGEKPYVCSICNKAFNRKETLDIHSRRHEKKIEDLDGVN